MLREMYMGYGSKIKPRDRRCWSMFPFSKIPFWAPIFDPQLCREPSLHSSPPPEAKRRVVPLSKARDPRRGGGGEHPRRADPASRGGHAADQRQGRP